MFWTEEYRCFVSLPRRNYSVDTVEHRASAEPHTWTARCDDLKPLVSALFAFVVAVFAHCKGEVLVVLVSERCGVVSARDERVFVICLNVAR